MYGAGVYEVVRGRPNRPMSKTKGDSMVVKKAVQVAKVTKKVGSKTVTVAKAQVTKKSGARKVTSKPQVKVDEFINKAKETHKNKCYDYNKVVYEGGNKKVQIICPKHGIFFQLPQDHLEGKGCTKCATDEVKPVAAPVQEAKPVETEATRMQKIQELEKQIAQLRKAQLAELDVILAAREAKRVAAQRAVLAELQTVKTVNTLQEYEHDLTRAIDLASQGFLKGDKNQQPVNIERSFKDASGTYTFQLFIQ